MKEVCYLNVTLTYTLFRLKKKQQQLPNEKTSCVMKLFIKINMKEGNLKENKHLYLIGRKDQKWILRFRVYKQCFKHVRYFCLLWQPLKLNIKINQYKIYSQIAILQKVKFFFQNFWSILDSIALIKILLSLLKDVVLPVNNLNV